MRSLLIGLLLALNIGTAAVASVAPLDEGADTPGVGRLLQRIVPKDGGAALSARASADQVGPLNGLANNEQAIVMSVVIAGILCTLSMLYYFRVYRHALVLQLTALPSGILDSDPENLRMIRFLLLVSGKLEDVLKRANSSKVWLDNAVAFTHSPPSRQVEILADRLNAEFEMIPSSVLNSISGFHLRLPRDIVQDLEDAVLFLPDFLIPPNNVLSICRSLGLGSDEALIVLSNDPGQRQALIRMRDSRGRGVVVLSGGEITHLLLGPDPRSVLANSIARSVDLAVAYQASMGLHNGTIFFGRSAYIDRILNRAPGNYILVGARQVGKSSLLRAIERRARWRSDIWVRYASIGENSISSVFARLTGLPVNSNLDETVNTLRNMSLERPLVLLLDEADKFVELDSQSDPPFLITDAMRLLSAEGKCYFVMAGFWKLFEMVHISYHAPLRNFGETLILGGLESESARALLRKPMARLGVVWSDEALVDLVLTATGCRPNLLQIIGDELQRGVGPFRVIEERDVGRALSCQAVANNLLSWRNFTDDHRANCLDQILVWAMLNYDRFTLTELSQRMAAIPEVTRVRLREWQQSLQRLVLAFILGEENGAYDWCVPLFRTRRLLEVPSKQLHDELDILAHLGVPDPFSAL